MDWKPISECPEFKFSQEDWYLNGPRYLLWIGYQVIGSYGYTEKGKGRWKRDNGYVIEPTHYMDLPDGPTR